MSNLQWQKSSFSSSDPNQTCLEAATDPSGRLYFRESEDPETVLTTTPARLAALLHSLR
ncbi:hypothetical protein GCM10009716_43130 [Streptomyces sodiiphilus]|uniref:DUF397 domain-containing protein n=1 Tax=Streptomyces sodiiphilus TaxID=226217 RepID=A0ABP5B7T6_9ACTN